MSMKQLRGLAGVGIIGTCLVATAAACAKKDDKDDEDEDAATPAGTGGGDTDADGDGDYVKFYKSALKAVPTLTGSLALALTDGDSAIDDFLKFGCHTSDGSTNYCADYGITVTDFTENLYMLSAAADDQDGVSRHARMSESTRVFTPPASTFRE